ncbi:BnaA09g17490D [Brassica napus]|uniref:(rape) hypothetical protein n=1 Tax=Brassica napus TaxID=3708 RepID=A0A078FLI5_BRANA|nr:unnamed protein product [Brassica napus]CDY13068.1 BnaA09g17490D [Brassica napus]
MVSQSNAAGSSGRRRRANTPKAKPVSRSKKTKRYPEFSLVPEAEQHFWLDEVEDTNVTRLVDHIRSGHTFRTEDFEGGDMSFGKDNATPEGKPQGVPLRQRTLRPRKRATVVIEDLTTPEHNKPDVPPESGRSPNEDLKSWIQLQFQNFKNGIYERLDQFEKTLCDHFGVPLLNIHNKGKRKVGEDDHGYSGSPKSVENQYKKHRPNRKSRNVNSAVPKPGHEMHSYPLRSADGLEGTIENTQPGFGRETREKNENSAVIKEVTVDKSRVSEDITVLLSTKRSISILPEAGLTPSTAAPLSLSFEPSTPSPSAVCEFNPKDVSTASTCLIKNLSILTIQEIAAIKKKTFPYSFAANTRVSELQEKLKSIDEGQRRVYLEQRIYLSARIDHLTEHIICLPPHFKPHYECMLRVYKTELGKRTPLGGDDGASSSSN